MLKPSTFIICVAVCIAASGLLLAAVDNIIGRRLEQRIGSYNVPSINDYLQQENPISPESESQCVPLPPVKGEAI